MTKTHFKFMKTFSAIAIVALAIIGLQSCYKKDYTTSNNSTQFDNSKMVTASVHGIVQDEAGMPIKQASVKCNGYSTTTDDNGLFFFSAINTPSHVTSVMVSKDTYFNGNRTMSVQANQTHTMHITLLKKENPEVFNANNGGTVSFAGGMSITFPANGIVNKQTGTPYNGQVYVYAKKIDPTTALGKTSMPGDLRGITTNGTEKLLETFGMMVAELYDINGVPMQIAPTSAATLNYTVPVSLQGKAPATMVLWYFDEVTGIWKEQGSAVLTGNQYVGKVTHFSFWNCDTPQAAIDLEMTLQDQNANPLAGYEVRLTNTANQDSRTGVTNAGGWVGGLCYSNAVLTLEVFSNNICGANIPLYTTTITTGAVNMNLGVITINLAQVASCSFNATVLDCLGFPVTNGSVLVQPLNLILNTNALGQVSYTLPCTPVSPITLSAYDLTNNVYSTSNYTLVPGVNNIGNLTACGNIAPFLNLTLTNTISMATANANYTLPLNSLTCYLQNPNTYINASDGISGIGMAIDGSVLGTFNVSSSNLNGMFGVFTDSLYTLTGINNATFTAFPAFPGDVQGSYNLNYIGTPSGNTYTAIGTFRIPRSN